MTLHEPATFVTDLLLAALGVGLALHLKRHAAPSAAGRWWIAAIALMAASAFVGGCYHGFAPEFPALEPWWWRGVLWIICGIGLAMGMSLLHELRPHHRGWRWVLAGKFALAVTAATIRPEFLVAMSDYGSAMLAWAVAALIARRPWSRAILTGVGLSALAAVVQQAEWGLSRHFNHNDVFHVIQALALLAFHRAGLRLSPAITRLGGRPSSSLSRRIG